uniref:Uncharacterized protein n=1 Tax=Panagrolaimus sp. JU765 TaxID=591449 RepID=A0AC34PZ11_9BILA
MFIVQGELDTRQIATMEIIKTMDQKPMVNFRKRSISGKYLNESIKNRDIVTRNNVIHVINGYDYKIYSLEDTLHAKNFDNAHIPDYVHEQESYYNGNVATFFCANESCMGKMVTVHLFLKKKMEQVSFFKA